MCKTFKKLITKPRWKKTHSKITVVKPNEDIKSSGTKNVHEICDKMVVNFI